ncbi:molybdenum cofactor guanylyltransferase [Moorella thermoacetica]|nr:molybdenum cofactor guanylyltransferase [Moorella thermoacetica]
MTGKVPANLPPAGGIVLAGGKSTPMGTNKALLPLREKSLLATMVTVLRPLFNEIIVVANTPDVYRLAAFEACLLRQEYQAFAFYPGVRARYIFKDGNSRGWSKRFL